MERDGNVFRYRVRSVLETVMLEVTTIFLIFLAASFLLVGLLTLALPEEMLNTGIYTENRGII